MAAFTVTSNVNESVVALVYTDQRGTFLIFEPERQEFINIADGKYSFSTTNGCCSLSWDDVVFDFELSKHGDGNGGTLGFIVAATPELKASFNRAIITWNEAVQKIKVHEKTADNLA